MLIEYPKSIFINLCAMLNSFIDEITDKKNNIIINKEIKFNLLLWIVENDPKINSLCK